MYAAADPVLVAITATSEAPDRVPEVGVKDQHQQRDDHDPAAKARECPQAARKEVIRRRSQVRSTSVPSTSAG